MKNFLLLFFFLVFPLFLWSQEPVDYVNPFIGTSNYGATNPGAIAPRGMASVCPFNVAGKGNQFEKDSEWLSAPYVYENKYLSGFSHVNLSGVGCPDLGVILLMPTSGELETDYLKYRSRYENEVAKAGYYSAELTKYNIKAEATASTRVGVSRYSFPSGKSNILLNLGLGLTNEQGGMLKINSPSEVEGFRMVGSFCYNSPEQAYPVYFVARLSKPADDFGIWKTPYVQQGEEAQWMPYNGKPRVKKAFRKEVAGDSIGAYFSYEFKNPEQVEVKVGISYVSIANARENLEKEVGARSFDEVYEETIAKWNHKLKTVEVEGGTKDEKTIFYTALYHTQIHPNILNDVNGEYPEIFSRKTAKTKGVRYTVFSLWDTYRNYHQLMTLLYPEEQLGMINSMLDIYDESGWLPKWELNSTETYTMVGDPAAIVIADTYRRGLRDFDVEKAYEAMVKSGKSLEDNPLRPGLKEYLKNGYLSVEGKIAGPVSVSLEYNMADYAIAQMARQLGKQEDYQEFSKRAMSYRKLYNPDTGFLQPKYQNGEWYQPFDPEAGANFGKNVGYIEGNAWQYLFMVPFDIEGLSERMGGKAKFEEKLDQVFERGHFDMANEPDIAYPYLYDFVPGSEWKTSKEVTALIRKYFRNSPDGLPGNDDTGTMSAWLVYSMMGLYPVVPSEPLYALGKPAFDKIRIHLNEEFYDDPLIKIDRIGGKNGSKLEEVTINGKKTENYFIANDLIIGSKIIFRLSEEK